MSAAPVKTRYKFFTVNGLVARALILGSKISPQPTDTVVAVAYGIVEMLGYKRLLKILGPAIKAQLKSMGRREDAGAKEKTNL